MKTIVLLACLLPCLLQAQTEKRIALLIGNNAYTNAPLKNPLNDARAVETALRGCGFETDKRENLDYEAMTLAVNDFHTKIEKLKKQKHHVTALVYFSGHGLQHNGTNYLIPINAVLTTGASLRTRTYNLDELVGNVGKADLQILMIDACRENAFQKSWAKDIPIVEGLADFKNETTLNNQTPEHLPQGTLLCFAAAPNKKAIDTQGADKTSPYVEAFLRAMQNNAHEPIQIFFQRVGNYLKKITSNDQQSWVNGNPTGEIFYFKKTILPNPTTNTETKTPQKTAEEWFNEGYDNNTDKQKEIQAYTEAIKLKPNYPEAYNWRGRVKKNLGKYQEAIEDYTQAIKLKPDYADSYNNRGNVKYDLKQYQEAIEDYTKSIELKNPKLHIVYNNRGLAKYNLQQYQETIEDYNQAIKLKPDFAEAYNNRGVAKKNLEKYQEAIEDYNQAIKFKPDYTEAFWNSSLAYAYLEDKKGVIKSLREAIRFDEQNKKEAKTESAFNWLREDADFQALLK